MHHPPELGRFQIVRELGRGGMGVVYEVRDPEHPARALALKLLLSTTDPQALARFAREAQALARVRHGGVVVVHALDRTPRGEPYLLTDLVPGRDLAAHVQATSRLTPAAAAALVRDVADAMAAVHAAGVIHRDLKPANVLIRPDGTPVIIDFGLAHAVDRTRLTETGTVMGTPAFMAPEQAEGAIVDARTDVYGLGAILYWLLAGRAPFSGPPVQALFALLHKEPMWPAEVDPMVPRGLDAICRQAMAKDPASRPPDAAALRDALARWLADGEPAPTSRRGLKVAALAVLGALGIVATSRREPAHDRSTVAAPPSSASLETAAPAVVASSRRGDVLDPASRTTWIGGTWDERAKPLQVRFLDDDRVMTLGRTPAVLRVHHVSPAFPARRPHDFALDDPGWGAMVRVAPGRVLFSTSKSVWCCDGERTLLSWRGDPEGGGIEALAFEPSTGRAIVAGRNLLPTLLSARDSATVRTGTLDQPGREGLRIAIAFCGGRVVEVHRLEGAGVMLVWSSNGTSKTRGLPSVSSLAVNGEGPLVAVGLQNRGEIILFDVSEPEPRELTTIRLDDRVLTMATGTQIRACVFGPDRLWAAAPRAIWSWHIDAAALLRGESPPQGSVEALPADFGSPSSIDLSPDGALIVVGSESGNVRIRGVDAAKE